MPEFFNRMNGPEDIIMVDEDEFDGLDIHEESIHELEFPVFDDDVFGDFSLDGVDTFQSGMEHDIEEIVVSDEDDEDGDVDLSKVIPGSRSIYKEDEAEEEEEKTWSKDKEHSDFIAYLKVRVKQIPKHSGETLPGCERAKSFLRGLDGEISKAMRSDSDGVIDESEVDEIRRSIESMVDRLDNQIGKIRGKRASVSHDVKLVSEAYCSSCNTTSPMWNDTENDRLVCMACNADRNDSGSLEKTAATPIINVYISAFERAVVGIIINATVSAGKNMEEVYDKMKNKYNFAPREELAIQQLIADYGYPVFKDRGLLNEPVDPSSGEGVEWQTNYNS